MNQVPPLGRRQGKRARDLKPGDVVFFSTRPLRTVAEVRLGTVISQHPPYREYKVLWVRWEGEEDFGWKKGLSDLVSCVLPEEPVAARPVISAIWDRSEPRELSLEEPVLENLLPDDDWCRRCQRANPIWSAPSPLWNAVMRGGSINGGPEPYNGIICMLCFAELAEEAGIAGMWRLDATDVEVELETVTPSGRVWNPQTWMFEEPHPKEIGNDESR